MSTPPPNEEDTEIARQAVSLCLEHQEAAWEPVRQLVATYRRAVVAEAVKSRDEYINELIRFRTYCEPDHEGYSKWCTKLAALKAAVKT